MTLQMRALFLALSVGLSAAACGRGGAGSTAAAPAAAASDPKAAKDQIVLSLDEQATGRIETQPAEAADIPDLLRVSGRITLADDRTWHVGVRTDGLVRFVAVTVDDVVREGQVLARYHADEVREERAKYRRAMSELREHEAATALAKRNLDRARTLLELKAASVQQVDQAQQDLVAAESDLQNARTEVDRTTDVLEDDLRVPVEPKAGNDDADLVPITAPAGGYVIAKNVTPGQTIAPGQDAFVIGDLSRVWMLASIRQDALNGLRVGQPVSVLLPGSANERFSGTIRSLGEGLDPATRTLQARIVLNNPAHRLRPEMLATAEIPVGHLRPALAVPSDAVQQVNGQDVVFVRTAPDRFTVRAVHVAPTTDGRTPILEGLAPGEQVVVRGSFVLKSHLLRSSMEGE